MNALYEARVSAVSGRSGSIRRDDGVLDLPLSVPRELGGKGEATNQEQLFAAGYAACFGNAVIHVTRTKVEKVHDGDVEVVGHVGLNPHGQNDFANLTILTWILRPTDQRAFRHSQRFETAFRHFFRLLGRCCTRKPDPYGSRAGRYERDLPQLTHCNIGWSIHHTPPPHQLQRQYDFAAESAASAAGPAR